LKFAIYQINICSNLDRIDPFAAAEALQTFEFLFWRAVHERSGQAVPDFFCVAFFVRSFFVLILWGSFGGSSNTVRLYGDLF
jgi:hypothetical protein